MDDGEGRTTEAELEGEEDEQRRAEVTQSRKEGRELEDSTDCTDCKGHTSGNIGLKGLKA